MTTAAAAKLDRLTGFLAQDPQNSGLLAEAAGAALDARRPDLVEGFLGRYEIVEPLPTALSRRARPG